MVDSVFYNMVTNENEHHDELYALHATDEVKTHLKEIETLVGVLEATKYVAHKLR